MWGVVELVLGSGPLVGSPAGQLLGGLRAGLFQFSSWERKASCVTGQPCWSPVGFFPFPKSAVPKLVFQIALQ